MVKNYTFPVEQATYYLLEITQHNNIYLGLYRAFCFDKDFSLGKEIISYLIGQHRHYDHITPKKLNSNAL